MIAARGGVGSVYCERPSASAAARTMTRRARSCSARRRAMVGANASIAASVMAHGRIFRSGRGRDNAHGTGSVVDALLAHRAEQQAGEAAPAPGTDHQ